MFNLFKKKPKIDPELQRKQKLALEILSIDRNMWDVVIRDEDGTYPDTPFFNMILERFGTSPYFKLQPSPQYGGLEEWMEEINNNPHMWEITGTRQDFMINRTCNCE